jgi:hypothetical protein
MLRNVDWSGESEGIGNVSNFSWRKVRNDLNTCNWSCPPFGIAFELNSRVSSVALVRRRHDVISGNGNAVNCKARGQNLIGSMLEKGLRWSLSRLSGSEDCPKMVRRKTNVLGTCHHDEDMIGMARKYECRRRADASPPPISGSTREIQGLLLEWAGDSNDSLQSDLAISIDPATAMANSNLVGWTDMN